ncbi:regulator of cell autolysis [Flavobacterium akiainvivens]|uniref:Regulator of cell autolysis n=1 Tax=Flavobacterium akiainvivens TaxID=1202724 RepID=A0A0M8MCK5_9FLAO|nr:histidine kinase [Flavobacterium akiainvivens]KOS08403.1 regulator of cell autolysis [Flavobacterium akiainvivens]SFQ22237.1 Histidine kinase-, DNA gyrase B-, and HSP90-like ATPase [Flavobacterium akiainvivens]
MYRFTGLLLFLMLFTTLGLRAQTPVQQKKEMPGQLKSAASNLEKSLLENDNPKIARNYEALAEEYIDKDDLKKAKQYLLKALTIYKAAKDATAPARVLRKIALVQEQLNQLSDAQQNFKTAAEASANSTLKTINLNDYNRLKNNGNTEAETKYLIDNIALLKKVNKDEVAVAYTRLAKVYLKTTDTLKAIEQYKQAQDYATALPAKSVKMYAETARLYTALKQYPEAIEAEAKLLAIAKKTNDTETQIYHLRSMAAAYFKLEDTQNGIGALKQSYDIAAANGKTFEARESIWLLADYYKSVPDSVQTLAVYEGFLKNLDRIILSDKSLTDAKTFRVTEERIRQLESEKTLKDELITRKNTFSYFLLGSIVLLLVFLAFIFKTLRSIKAKNKEIALQALRREMNPHFLFNSLNSVNQFIAQNNELEANKFLTSYSNLMRNTMENSNKDFVTLGKEVENLTQYLELEHLRFKDKFRFEITVDQKLDVESVWVPNMIIQPHLENAIWHGLRYKDEKGLLKLDFTLKEKNLIVTVDDNGIGITKSNELKTHNQKAHTSRGITNTHERMVLLNELHKTRMAFTVNEKEAPQSGTVVTITLPIKDKP